MTKNPRISANKLAEFMGAKSARQRQILHDQKYPKDFKTVYYKEAPEAAAHFVAGGAVDASIIETAIGVLENKAPSTIGADRRINSNIEALETLKLMLDDIPVSGVTLQLAPNSAPYLTFFGVDISVRPEIIVKGKSGKGPTVGAMKFHFPRSFCHTDDTGGYVCALLTEWCRIHMSDHGLPQGNLCSVIDVGSQRVYLGKKATAARLKDVSAACQNIAGLWPTI